MVVVVCLLFCVVVDFSRESPVESVVPLWFVKVVVWNGSVFVCCSRSFGESDWSVVRVGGPFERGAVEGEVELVEWMVA